MDEGWGIEPRIEAGKVRLRKVLTPRETTITDASQIKMILGRISKRRSAAKARTKKQTT